MKYQCILLAAGEGQRAALGYNKVLYRINGTKEIVLFSLEYFLNDDNCERIVLVISQRDKAYFHHLIEDNKVVFVLGGATRGESVSAGLKLITSEYVIVHDAARPLVYKEDVRILLDSVQETGGATLACNVYNTTCKMNEGGYVEEYFSRHTLASIITPQCFRKDKLEEAYKESLRQGRSFTDDSGIFKAYSGEVKLVFTNNVSIKVTTSYEIKLLEAIYASR